VELVRKLRQRQQQGEPICVGVVGCGQMGSGLVHAVNSIVGMHMRAIADIEPQRGIDTFGKIGRVRDDIVVTEKKGEAEDALKSGKVVVTSDALMLPQLEGLAVNVEVTGIPDVGAQVAWHSIMNRKPVVTLNAEMDVTVGPLLCDLARRQDTVYTVASGDEPGVCKMLYEQAVLMGFEVVCLGKGKNNPINFAVTPEMCIEEAQSKSMNPKMLCAFIDGTKTMVEMAAVSNATGLSPDLPGMHGPKVELDELTKVFVPKSDGGILEDTGRVDYSTGKISPGVFAIVYADDKRIRKDMKFITKSDGPYYLHYRPYHLCDLETPQSIAEAVLLGEVTVASDKLCSEVVCVSKRDIKAGEKVEGIGGSDIRGYLYRYEDAAAKNAIPLGIASGGKALRDIGIGEIMTEANFAPDESTFVYRLRKMQDKLLAGMQ